MIKTEPLFNRDDQNDTGLVGYTYTKSGLPIDELPILEDKIKGFIASNIVTQGNIYAFKNEYIANYQALNYKTLTHGLLFALFSINHTFCNPLDEINQQNHIAYLLKCKKLEDDLSKFLPGFYIGPKAIETRDFLRSHWLNGNHNGEDVNDKWFLLEDSTDLYANTEHNKIKSNCYYFIRKSPHRNIDGQFNIEIYHINFAVNKDKGLFDLEVSVMMDTNLMSFRANSGKLLDVIFDHTEDFHLNKFKPMLRSFFTGFGHPQTYNHTFPLKSKNTDNPKYPYWWETPNEFLSRMEIESSMYIRDRTRLVELARVKYKP